MQMGFYIAFLRALYLFYQNAHWQSNGPGSYSNHLMFQRLYENVLKEIDDVAEKSIALFDNEVLDLSKQNEMIFKILSKYSVKSNDFVITGIEFEKAFQDVAIRILNELKEQNKLSKGLENKILGQLDSSENPRCYLLKQNI